MKTLYVSVILTFLLISGYCQKAPTGDIWLHMLTTGQPAATKYLGDQLNGGSNWYIQFEVGQATWTTTEAGIGQSNSDPSGWSWQTASWYADGSGSNKQVQSNFGNFRFTQTGTWYFAGRAKGDAGDAFHYANSDSWGNSGTFEPIYYFTVSALNTPTDQTATLNSSNPSSQIDLSWAKDAQNHNVMIVRKLASQSWTEPTQGVTYAVSSNIGAGVVVYNGSGISYANTVSSSAAYDYKFYSENYNYYSSGVTSSTVTTNSLPTDYFRSLTNGNWNVSTSWESSSDNANWVNATTYPDGTSNITTVRSGHTITLSANADVKYLSIESGGNLDCIGFTLNITSAGSITNNGAFTRGTGTVAFAGTGSVIGGTNFNNVTIQNGVNFGNMTSVIFGTLTFNTGAFIDTHAPYYATGSTLKYNTGGTYGRALEWSNTSGNPAYPYHVQISNSTLLNMGANGSGTTTSRECAGNLTVDAGSEFSMKETGCIMTVSNTIIGDIINNGTISLSTSVGGDLNIRGNWTANNVLNHNNRAVTFQGTAATEISCGAITFAYLTIDNSAGVSINTSGLVMVANDLTINSGRLLNINPGKQLTVNGTIANSAGNTGLVIKSDATGTGSLLHNTADVPATIERYVSGSTVLSEMRYHLVSVPLTPATPDFSIIFLDSYLFNFDEPTDLWVGLGAPIDTPLDETRGYMTYAPVAGTSYYFLGPMNNGSFTTNTTATPPYNDNYHGWNLVPNPFPSALDWDASSGWSRTNIDGGFYIWDATLAQYASYVGGLGQNNGTQYIPVGQAFFVHANAASPILTLDNGSRLHNNLPFWKNNEYLTQNLLRLKATTNISSDETVIHFRDDATNNFDANFDANKLKGGSNTPQLSSVINNDIKLSINSLPLNESNVIIPLDFSLDISGSVTFTASGMESFNSGMPIYLEDLLTDNLVDLRTNPIYHFNHSIYDNNNRFRLRFIDVTSTCDLSETSKGFVFFDNNKLFLEVPDMQQSLANISVYDALGRQISNSRMMMNGITEIPAPSAKGVYIVKVRSINKNWTGKVIIN